MGSIVLDYQKLYILQDEVIKVVFEVENIFYLTGGTCLSRFYQEKRYSDDLDFFTNRSPRYSFAIKNIKKALLKKFDLQVEIESKDFTRYKINNLLQVDFVNDIDSRYKDVVVTKEGFIIDNVENILSNKLTAVMGRDNPKDIFDIYLIWNFYDFSWQDILDSAHEKAGFSDEELIVRLKSFPKILFDEIHIIDTNFLTNFDFEFPELIHEISTTIQID
ncbi:nucleotidyl transferase AbiEii/AbiGii toxin family protein [Sulfurovum sp.]|jgi:predicted nucleotidyltransferase component of viral defense system|uniref:nucleotidyl transferase AbiEii/AbiGii toxin family protein n=1 Tax=Sulfurovum sp. TaxID=1969726 RepID=UPI002A36D156|nr:nucleotidyl transferase AbiEii/AbiGii toxin family protein [Sulfurovum sp.]MDD2450291.1 nucleotidyl transferase AbiEii/AbiGii toxin family protein [Sulfurovum sp.]MDD3499592.1 nucleotidyl transferase AbiEii/AbiGii toxin family protein [Sulfurovum sp.]MDY0401909.1 nucleotidyl transferase AbiEii/AbiGii toxin family protein [Sulfurovum sp.]